MSGNLRNVALDYAKGFAILLIVLYHIYGYTCRGVGSIVNAFCYTVQLPIFFYISGMLIAMKSLHRIDLKIKARRLLVPFFCFYFIWCVINYNDIYNFIHDEFKGGYWFVIVLFEMMTICSLSSFLADRLKTDIVFTLIGSFIILTIYETLFPRDSIFNVLMSINLLWHYFPFFFLGLYHNHINNVLKFRFLIIYVLLFIILQYFYYTYSIRMFLPLCNLFSLLLFLTLFLNGFRPFEKTISKFGAYSMQIYLLHFFLVDIFCDFIPIVSNRYIEFFFYIFLSILFIYIILYVSDTIIRNKWVRLLLFGVK